MARTQTIEVEFDGPKNQSVYFRPLQRKIRGRFDAHRVVNGGRLMQKFSDPIPGQRLQVDPATGAVTLFEPLHDNEHAATRERIEASGAKLGPQYEDLGRCDVVTLAYWLRSLIDDGLAKLMSGELPKMEGKPQTRFHSAEQPDPIEKLGDAIEKQTEVITRLLGKLTS